MAPPTTLPTFLPNLSNSRDDASNPNSPHLSAYSTFSPNPTPYPEDQDLDKDQDLDLDQDQDLDLDIDDAHQDTISRAQNRAKGRQRSLMIIRAEMEREDEERRMSLADAWDADADADGDGDEDADGEMEGTYDTHVEHTPMPEPSAYLPRIEMDIATAIATGADREKRMSIEELLEMEDQGWDFESADVHPASPHSFDLRDQPLGHEQELELMDEEREELENVISLPHPSYSHELEQYEDAEGDYDNDNDNDNDNDERDRDDESHAWGYDDEHALHSEDEDTGDTPTATPRRTARSHPRALSTVSPKHHQRFSDSAPPAPSPPAVSPEIAIENQARTETRTTVDEVEDDGNKDQEGTGEKENDTPLSQVQTHEPVKRRISVRLPPQLLPTPSSSSSSSTPLPDPSSALHRSPKKSPTKTIVRSGSVPSLRAKVSRETLNDRLEGVVKKSGIVPSTTTTTATTAGRRVSVLNKESMSSLAPVAEANGGGGVKVVQKKNSFSFATPGSPLKVKMPLSPSPPNTAPSATSPKKTSRNPSPTKPNPIPESSSNRNLSPTKSPLLSKPMERAPSDMSIKSQATNETPTSQPPALASPRASDSASSEGRWLESPRGKGEMQQLHFLSPVSNGAGSQSFSPTSPHDGLEWGIVRQQQKEQESLGSPFASLSLHPPTDSVMSRLSLPHARSSLPFPPIGHHHSPVSKHDTLPIPFDEMSIHDTPSSALSSPSSCHSMLPSVKTKIAQMESREEALRKFSVSGSAMLSPPLSSKRDSERQNAWGMEEIRENENDEDLRNHHRGQERRTPVKRKSYTAALAPRTNRMMESKPILSASRPFTPRQTSTSTMHSAQSTSSGSSYDYDPIYAPESNTRTPKTPKRLPAPALVSDTTPTASPRNSIVSNGRLPIAISPASSKSTTTSSYGDLMSTPKLDPFGLGYTSSDGINGGGSGVSISPIGGGLHKVDEEVVEREGLPRQSSTRPVNTMTDSEEQGFKWNDYGEERSQRGYVPF